VFETVFSDPAGAKIRFLEEVAPAGYDVVLCFIGIPSAELSDQRVAMRVSQGGHDVDPSKIASRFLRTMANLSLAIHCCPQKSQGVFGRGRAVSIEVANPLALTRPGLPEP
jgi:predicted ABC-type ATPase